MDGGGRRVRSVLKGKVQRSFRNVVSVGYGGELYVFGHTGAKIFCSLLDFLSLCAPDRFRVVPGSERTSGIIAVFLQFMNFSGEPGKRGGAALVFVRV